MAKFNVGDIIIGNEKNAYSVTAKGVKCEVLGVTPSGEINVKVLAGDRNRGSKWYVNPEYFDLVSSDEITITRHGNKVVAKYGKNVGVAKCSPEDEFDFAIGAKLAFERLMQTKKPEEIKVGDKVRVIGNSKTHHYFPIGLVVKVKMIDKIGDLYCELDDKRWQWVSPQDVEKITDDALDWDGFKAGKFFVKCTKDNYDSFIAEAKKHGCKFVPDENFNPFTSALYTVKLFIELSGHKTVDKNEVLVIFKDGRLKIDVAIIPDRNIVTW